MCCARHILGRLAPSLILRAGVDVVAVLDLCADRHQPFFDYWVVTNVARFAVVPAIVTHAMFNTVSRFLNGLFKEVQPSAAIPFELVLALGASVLVLCCCFLRGDDLGIRTLSIRVKKHQKFPSCPEWVFVPNSYDRSQSVRCPSLVPGRLSQLTRRILCAIRVRSLLIAGPRRFSKPSSRTPRSPRGCPTR